VWQGGHAPVAAYAGSIYSPGYQQALVQMAQALEGMGGRLRIYGHDASAREAMPLLQRGNIDFCGFFPSAKLIATLRQEADLLYLPMPFDEESRINARLSFPSKLTDYTAAGLPMIIHGPPDCSPVGWAKQHAGVALTVEELSPQTLEKEIHRLWASPQERVSLARMAMEIGRQEFSLEHAQDILMKALTSAPHTTQAAVSKNR
jgi:hypothetical protein